MAALWRAQWGGSGFWWFIINMHGVPAWYQQLGGRRIVLEELTVQLEKETGQPTYVTQSDRPEDRPPPNWLLVPPKQGWSSWPLGLPGDDGDGVHVLSIPFVSDSNLKLYIYYLFSLPTNTLWRGCLIVTFNLEM